MSKPISFGELDFKIVSSMQEDRRAPETETPFRMLILGDFSGRFSRGLHAPGTALDSQYLSAVDRDNIDDLPAELGVQINLSLAGESSPSSSIRIETLEDFHPDRLYENLDLFQDLKKLREAIQDQRIFASTPTPKPCIDDKIEPPKMPDIPRGSLLDQVIEETSAGQADKDPSSRTSEWDRYLQDLVKPHLVSKTDPRQVEAREAVEAAAGELMRVILHQPVFQEIEAAWRALYFLASRLETDAQLKLFLLDASKSELAADLAAAENLNASRTYKLLVEQTVETFGAEPWSLLVGCYSFDRNRTDAAILGRMAKIARLAGAPFIAAAHERLLGCESLAETPDISDWRHETGPEDRQAWKALRSLPETAYIGLVLPRFLLRLPYGADTDPIESFDFEEMPAIPEHEYYLWGNPSFACAYLLGRAFNQSGWNLRPGMVQDIEKLPLHIYSEQGESRIKPCAEVVFTERTAAGILDMGIMPLLSFREADMIRLARFQSLADPATNLAGRWK